MKRILYVLFPLFYLFIFVCDVAAYVERDTAVVRILNKAAGKVHVLELPKEETVNFEKISMRVKSCKQNDPFQAENFYLFIEIDKQSEGKIFRGWMNRNEPGQNPLQNADYDVWLVKCK